MLTLNNDVLIHIALSAQVGEPVTKTVHRAADDIAISVMLTSLRTICRRWRHLIDDNWATIVEHYTVIRQFTNGVTHHLFCGLRHRVGGPAIYDCDTEEWFQYGQRHRTGDQPAVIKRCVYYTMADSEDSEECCQYKRLEWWWRGQRHRAGDLPAVISEDEDIGFIEWWRRGKRHRDGDLPAVCNHKGWYWYQNDMRHRDGGKPAVVQPASPYDFTASRIKWDWRIDPSDPAYDWRKCHGYDGNDQIAFALEMLQEPRCTLKWYRQGDLHRDDGPACMRHNGLLETWHDGVQDPGVCGRQRADYVDPRRANYPLRYRAD